MGLEAKCVGRLNGQESEGKAHCGDGEIEFRGNERFRWKWSSLSSVESHEGVLTLRVGDDYAELVLGASADKWHHAILNPKSRMDKFGLKPGMRYQLWGEFDDEFPTECFSRAGEPDTSGLANCIFVRLNDEADLHQLVKARSAIEQNGMVWAIWIKGRKEFGETKIREFGLANGLVDVKIASVSQTLTSMKFVIRVRDRS